MYTIKINSLKLFGYHGVYEEEAVVGGNFDINIALDFENEEPINKLSDTINYARIIEITKHIFIEKEALLETIAQKLCVKFYAEFNFIKNINISIEKLNPPISNFTGSVIVVYLKSY